MLYRPETTQEVVVFTRPDIQTGLLSNSEACPYDRIVGSWQRVGESIQSFMLYDEEPIAERRLQLTTALSRRLVTSMYRLAQDELVNCHKFSRIMRGVPLSHTEQDEEPLIDEPVLSQTIGSLALGEVGVIHTESVGVLHSMVGLGTQCTESLQVMSVNGELGICSNQSMLDFYSRLFKEQAQLHAVPNFAIAA